MKIKAIFFEHSQKHGTKEPFTMEFSGNYAIETLLIKVSERFFGSDIAEKIEKLLKSKIKED